MCLINFPNLNLFRTKLYVVCILHLYRTAYKFVVGQHVRGEFAANDARRITPLWITTVSTTITERYLR